MQRIMVIGCGGAGKSTFCKRLHEVTGLELIHLDQHYWLPNWVEPDQLTWERKMHQLVARPQWIMDGNYGGTMDIRLQKADTVIFLDRSKWICLSRVIRRVIANYGRTRKDMGAGCEESFSWDFLKYIYHYNTTRRPGILKKLSQLDSDKEVMILRSNQEVSNYLQTMKKRYGDGM